MPTTSLSSTSGDYQPHLHIQRPPPPPATNPSQKLTHHHRPPASNPLPRIPGLGLEDGLRVIGTDKDAIDMATYVKRHEQIEIYVEHVIEQADESINVALALPLPMVGMDKGAKGNPEVELEDINIEEDSDHGGIGHEKVYYNSDTDDSVLDMDYPLTDDSDYDDMLFDKYIEKEDVIIEEMGNDLFGSDIEREDNNEKTNNYDLNMEGMRVEYDSEELISGEESENEDNQPADNRTFKHC
ncbi:hypothetical protein RHMOL_Rhmol02G0214200 [Rhododendron molle]|uniref:Uncharacterized protein n=1 Tax=Rhododendron molle TaxID=49168 RepID=A0ACC0PS81_RHOML|nr:hypothetical protein RHMOL_Rhmol02G0214200 [Rhododendron molle]